MCSHEKFNDVQGLFLIFELILITIRISFSAHHPGLLQPSSGDAYFYDYSVRRDLDILRSILGVCPQHDVLWGDLTAEEHMKLFAHLKDIPSDVMMSEIESLLEEVKLSNVSL